MAKKTNSGETYKAEEAAQLPLAEYTFVYDKYKYLVKNNFFVSIEELRQDEVNEIVPLNFTETQILTTAFKMAHILNEERKHYTAETVFKIPLDKFCETWNISLTNEDKKNGGVYHNIMNSITRLQKRLFRYQDAESDKTIQSGYFAYIKYDKSTIEFGFPKPFIPYLQQMNRFTWYYFENVIKLMDNGNASALISYSITLYENLQKNKNRSYNPESKMHEIEFSAPQLKKLLAVPKTYSRSAEFNRQILYRVVDYINQQINLELVVEPIKTGKTITSYKFVCKLPSRDLDFDFAVKEAKGDKPLLTVAQRKKLAKDLSNNNDFHALYCGLTELESDFISRIESHLMEPDKIELYWPHLVAVGCKSKKLERFIAERKKAGAIEEQVPEPEVVDKNAPTNNIKDVNQEVPIDTNNEEETDRLPF